MPLKALMADQAKQLEARGVMCARIVAKEEMNPADTTGNVWH